MPPLGTQYSRFVVKDDSYTIQAADDVITFTIASAKTATLPLAKTCTLHSDQNIKQINNVSGSSNDLTIAVQSDDVLIGEATLSPGETAILIGNGVTTWSSTGSSGVTGVSGFSGFSGRSGFSGWSGFSGASGTSGYSGFSGRSGYTGVSGYSGYSGVSGYSGFSGRSGYSGFSGYSGYSGV
jgi:collagen triple helix repeat protein